MIRRIALAIASIGGTSVSAQIPDTTQHLGTVVVSATKVPQPASTLTQAVTVISGDDLRARGVTRVSDALREVPGAAVVQSGSFGAVTSLFIRGGESRYTKVLIDGVAVNAPGGFFDFSHLTTENIERIEIVRGPGSVLYGADAVTGIVQIFTRKGTQPRASVEARGGTYHSFDVDAAAAAALGQFGYSLGAGQHQTDGILPFNNKYSNGTLSSAVTLLRGPRGEVDITSRYTAAVFHYPTDFVGQPVDTNSYRTQHRLTVGLDVVRNLTGRIRARLLAGDNDVHDLTEDIATPFGSTAPEHSASRSVGFRRTAEGRVSFFLPASITTTIGAGYEAEHEHASNSSGPVGGDQTETDAFDATRHNVSYYSEIVGDAVDRISYTISGRLDDNSDYRRFATYRVGANAILVPHLRLRGSLSSAFNAPAFNQLRPTAFTVGSPGLRPERSAAGEAGVALTGLDGRLEASANYFAQRFSDLIQYVNGSAPDFRGSYANLTAATSNGYEADLVYAPVPSFTASASFTVVKPRVRDVSPNYKGPDRLGDELIRRATHSGHASVSYRIHEAFFSAVTNYVGRRADLDFAQFPSPRVTLPAHATVDISSEVPLVRWMRSRVVLNARVENILNQQYEDVLHFPAPGRTILVGGIAERVF